MLHYDTDPNSFSVYPWCQLRQAALHIAVESGQEATAKLLLRRGTRLYLGLGVWVSTGNHPLTMAINWGLICIVKLFGQNHLEVLKVEVLGSYRTLFLAVLHNRFRVVQFLLGPNMPLNFIVDGDSDSNDMSALSSTAANRQLDLVKLLLDKGVNVNGILGWPASTALHAAVLSNTTLVEIPQLLTEAGADLWILDNYGRTPLSSLLWDIGVQPRAECSAAQVAIVRLLLNPRAQISPAEVEHLPSELQYEFVHAHAPSVLPQPSM